MPEISDIEKRAINWGADPKPITKPGLYYNLGLGVYHGPTICSGVSVSSSGLRKLLLRSPKHYWNESIYNPNRQPEEDTAAMRHLVLGRAMHHLMLGEPNFSKLFCDAPAQVPDAQGAMKDWSLKLNYAKAWKEAREREGRILIFPKEKPLIIGMARALFNDPIVKQGAFRGLVEHSGFWKDKPTGIWVKIRPDVIPTTSGDVVDLKTTTSVQRLDCLRTIESEGYHMQMALIRQGFRELKIPYANATLVFVERDPPHCVRAFELDEADLDRGEKLNRAALDNFARCWESKHWPGPGEGHVEKIRLPDTVRKRIDSQLKELEQIK